MILGGANQNAAVIVDTTGDVATKLGGDCDDVSVSCALLVPTQWQMEVAWRRLGVAWRRMGAAWLPGAVWQVVAACQLVKEVAWPHAPTHQPDKQDGE